MSTITTLPQPAKNLAVRSEARTPLNELRRQQEGLERLLARLELVIKRPAQVTPDGELNKH